MDSSERQISTVPPGKERNGEEGAGDKEGGGVGKEDGSKGIAVGVGAEKDTSAKKVIPSNLQPSLPSSKPPRQSNLQLDLGAPFAEIPFLSAGVVMAPSPR